MIALRAMAPEDLGRVAEWLRRPHVSRWWLPEQTLEEELDKLTRRLAEGADATTHLLIVEHRDDSNPNAPLAIGWCQWFRYDADPEEATELRARPGDCGLDYAIGDASSLGRGRGSQMLAALVHTVHTHHPGCGLMVVPEAANVASRRLLERGGFTLRAVRPVATEPHRRPMAIYRRDEPTDAG